MEYFELIFFPTTCESHYGRPFILYTTASAEFKGLIIRAAPSIEEIEQGRSRVYAMNRCVPFTDELWERCQQHIQKREALEAEYRELASLAKKKRKLL